MYQTLDSVVHRLHGVGVDEYLDNLYNNDKLYPSRDNVLKCLVGIQLNNIRMILVGQEPYKTDYATGIPFEVGDSKVTTPSLTTLQRVLSVNTIDFTSLPRQGVFIINASLTASRNSNSNPWYEINRELLNTICKENKHVIIVALGSVAKKLVESLDKKSLPIRFYTYHPTNTNEINHISKMLFYAQQCYRGIYGRNVNF